MSDKIPKGKHCSTIVAQEGEDCKYLDSIITTTMTNEPKDNKLSDSDQEVMKMYNDFWKPIIEKNGKINRLQLARELFDWHYQMEQIPTILDNVTGGALSKIGYAADTVVRAYEDNLQRYYLDKDNVQRDVEDLITNKKLTDKEKLNSIKEYLDIVIGVE